MKKNRNVNIELTPYVEQLMEYRESLYKDNNKTPIKEWQEKVNKVNTDLAHLVVVAFDKVTK